MQEEMRYSKGNGEPYPQYAACGLNCALCPMHHRDDGKLRAAPAAAVLGTPPARRGHGVSTASSARDYPLPPLQGR